MKRFLPLLHISFFFIISFLQTGTVWGQRLTFQHLTVEQGLSQNAVLAIAQDQQGYMWFGTSNGLNRYDGYRFTVFQSRTNDSTTLKGNTVLTILALKNQQVWVGSSTGLSVYDPKTNVFKRITFPSISDLSCNSLWQDMAGRVWVGTGVGLFRIDNPLNPQPKAVGLELPELPSGKWDIRVIFQDRDEKLWVGTTNGLFELNERNGNEPLRYYRHEPADKNSISGNYVTTVTQDRLGHIWIGTLNNGLNRYQAQENKFDHIVHQKSGNTIISNNIRKVLLDKEGRIWAGTQEGISILSEHGQKIESYQQNDEDKESLSQNSVHSLFQDASGNVWAGTYFGGVNFSYGVATDFAVIRKNEASNSISNNVISSIEEDENNNLWIGTEGGGLNYFDRKNQRFTVYKHQPGNAGSIGSNLVKVVYRDWQGNIWSGTHGGGLNLFDASTKTFHRFLFKENDAASLNAEVVALHEDKKGRFWVGTTFGMLLFNKQTRTVDTVAMEQFSNAPLGSIASFFLEDEKNRLWVATTDGLFMLDGLQFVKISSEQVNCIHQDSQSTIWFGVRQGGLAYYDEKNNRYQQLANTQLTNRNILGILEDNQQNLWLSTDNGIIKRYADGKQFQQFTVSDGLSGNAFNYHSFFKDSNGEFFFGGYTGITHFFPDKIATNKRTGNLVFTGLKLSGNPAQTEGVSPLLNQPIEFGRKLELKHDQAVIGIEFALLNFIKSNKNRYAYQMEGYDKDWIYTSIPVANYANIPPGNYRFIVKAANNDGIWTDPIQLHVKVYPPFWLTWIAFTLYTLALIAIAFFVIRYFFLGALLKKEEELHQVKLNFFTNISHEIRTHLTLIMAPVDRMLETEAANSYHQQQLRGVKLNASRLLKLVSELMDFRKAETGHLKLHIEEHNLPAFLEEIYDSFRDVFLQKSIAATFIYDGGPLPIYFDKEQMEKVFVNLLTNAIKFTPENGRIWVHIRTSNDDVEIEVSDNGRGIAPEYLDKVFTNFFQVADHGVQNTGYGIGLALSKNIVELHHGTIHAESSMMTDKEQGFTSFFVRLRKGTAHFDGADIRTSKHEPEPGKILRAVPPAAYSLNDGLAAGSRKIYTVLIVEDNPELINLVREAFKEQYRVEEASNGLEGLEKATELLPDLIISDVMMPLMDGFELCEKLKKDERTSHIPVILLTAKTTQTDQISGLETGADMYLTKPFSTRVLELNVRNLLAARDQLRNRLMQQFSITAPTHLIPVLEPAVPGNPVEQEFLQKLVETIEENMENPDFGVEMLSRKLAMSAPILYKKIKAVCNMSVNDFVKSIRLKKAAQLLAEKKYTVYEVAYAVGYNDRKYFSQEFKKQFGKTPTEYVQYLSK